MSLRRIALTLHSWVGLTFGAALIFLALTGAFLAARPVLEERVYQGLMAAPACVAALPLDDILAAARKAHPANKPQSIELQRAPERSVIVWFGDRDGVYLDPCRGRVLGVQNEYGGLFGLPDWLHRFKFVEDGKWIPGVVDIAVLFGLLVCGWLLWWPRNRAAVRTGFVYQGRLPVNARRLSLHRVIGIYLSALLLSQTVTGLPIAFQWGHDLIEIVSGSSAASLKPPPSPKEGKGAPLKMEALWSRFQTAAPSWTWATVRLPKNGMVRVEYRDSAAPHEEAKSNLYLNARSGAVIRTDDYASRVPQGRKIYLYIVALHRGLVGGLPYDLALLVMCLAIPVQAYSGAGSYLRRVLRRKPRSGVRVRVAAKTLEADGVYSFELVDADGKQLPGFSAGSHIDLWIKPDLIRQYSLCNDPGETHRYVVAVALNPDSRGGSKAMHEEVAVGSILRISAPKNHFPLAHGPGPSLLIAGGIGITPILCMAERLANIGEQFELHYCVRSMRRAPFAGRIAGSSYSGRVHYHVSDEGGRLDLHRLLSLHGRDTHIYVCGPPALIDAAVSAAQALGWADGHIHREYFKGAELDRSEDAPFEVVLASTGRTVEVPGDQTVVQALADIDVMIPVSCSEGVCGTCITRVIEGEPLHRDRVLSDEERARNDVFTPCCSRAAGGRLVLDL